jgi:general secretion pathway protein L
VAHQLIIRILDKLDPETGTLWAEWGLIHVELKRLLDVSVTPLSAIKPMLDSKYASLLMLKTIVLVPGQHVVLTQVNIPSKQSRQIQLALPFMLEEGLANEMNDNFLALGPRLAKGNLSVAVVTHKHMRYWLAQLTEARIKADYLAPETLLLPGAEQNNSLLVGADRSWLRYADYQGLVFANAQWPTVLDGLDEETKNRGFMLMSAADESAKRELEQIKQELERVLPSVVRESANALDENTLSASALLSSPLADKHAPILKLAAHWLSPLHAFAEEILGGNKAVLNFSLLQGPYKPKGPALSLGFNWKPMAAVAALWFVSLITLQLLSTQRLNQEAAGYAKEAETLYRQYFPEDKRIVDIKSQTLAHLKRGGVSGSERSALELLHPAGKSVYQFNQQNKTQPLQISRLSFEQRQGDLLLDVRAKQFNQLDQLKVILEKEGLKVEIGSAVAQGDGVESRLKIKGS